MNCRLIGYLICFASGILVTTYQPLPWGFLFSASLILIVGALHNRLFAWRKSPVCILLLLVILGAVRQQVDLEQLKYADRMLLNKELEVYGIIWEEPILRVGSIDYVVQVMLDNKGENTGKILIKLKDKLSEGQHRELFSYGDWVVGRGIIEQPAGPTNPGQFDYRKYCRQQGITGIMSVEQLTGFTKPGANEEASLIIKAALGIKNKLRSVLVRSFDESDYVIIDGIIFGGTRGLNPDLKTDLQKTGVIHVLSVSGLHVGLVLGGVFMMTRLLGAGNRTTNLVALTVLLFYVLMTGLRPSVIRAAVMAVVPLLSLIAGRKSKWPIALATAGFVLLLWSPANLFNPGAQLSAAATWGILYLTEPIRRMLSFLPVFLRSSIAVILAAQGATLPLVAYYFNYISLTSIMANLIVVPLISMIVLLTCFTLAAGLVSMPVAILFAVPAARILEVIKLIIWYTGKIPFGAINIKSPALWQVLFLYGALFLLGRLYWQDSFRLRMLWQFKRRKRMFGIAVLIMVILFLWQGILFPQKWLQATFLDVGQGDCAVILTPGNKVIVIDVGGAGDNNGFDAGRAVLVPYLRYYGVQKIDYLFISHFHNDHVGGIRALVREFPIERVVVPSLNNLSQEAEHVLSLLNDTSARLLVLKPMEQILLEPDISATVMGPPSGIFGEDENENSLVVKLKYGRISYMFTGDIGKQAIEYYTSAATALNQEGLRAQVLKVPHHGSKGALSREFYEAVNPKAAVFSVGRNFFGHPDKGVIEALVQEGSTILRTDRQGAVLTRTDGNNLVFSTFGKENGH